MPTKSTLSCIQAYLLTPVMIMRTRKLVLAAAVASCHFYTKHLRRNGRLRQSANRFRRVIPLRAHILSTNQPDYSGREHRLKVKGFLLQHLALTVRMIIQFRCEWAPPTVTGGSQGEDFCVICYNVLSSARSRLQTNCCRQLICMPKSIP